MSHITTYSYNMTHGQVPQHQVPQALQTDKMIGQCLVNRSLFDFKRNPSALG